MISGIVVDSSTNQPIKGVKLTSSNGDKQLISTTDSNGKFTIDVPSFPNNLTISYVNYTTKEIKPFKGDGEVKTDLGPILLSLTQTSNVEDNLKSIQMDKKSLKSILQPEKDAEFYLRKRLTDSVNDIKSQLIPITLSMLTVYGISKADDIIKKQKNEIQKYIDNSTCPTPDALDKLLNKKNKLYKKLNHIASNIDSTTKALGITNVILDGMNLTLQIIKSNPAPAGAVSVGALSQIEGIIKKIETAIKVSKSISVGTILILSIIRQVLTQLMQYLSLLDMLIQHCAPNTPQSQELLNLSLLELNKEIEPVPNVINGFTLTVETEITEKPLKRKRAIAKNKSGVNLLQGEWSFSSIDQILIDELIFYIQTNDLKAY